MDAADPLLIASAVIAAASIPLIAPRELRARARQPAGEVSSGGLTRRNSRHSSRS